MTYGQDRLRADIDAAHGMGRAYRSTGPGPTPAPDASRCWHYLHAYGHEPIRCNVTPDYHDGPCDFPRKDDPR